MDAVCSNVHHSNPTYTLTLSLFLPLLLFLLPLSLPLRLYLSSSVSHSLSGIFSCLLLHYHTNTLAHTLGKKKNDVGRGEGG